MRDLFTGNVLRKLSVPAPITEGIPTVRGATFVSDRTLVTWTWRRVVQVWDLTTGREIRQFPFLHSPDIGVPIGVDRDLVAYQAVVSPDGKTIAYGGQQPYNLTTGNLIRRIDNLPAKVNALAFSPDSRMLAWSGFRDPTVRLIEIATVRHRKDLMGHGGDVSALAFSADGKTLVSASSDTTGLVWDLSGRHSGTPLPHLSLVELGACWADLASVDAARAYQAIRKLAADPARSVPFLDQRLQAVPSAPEAHLARLIADLDSSTFAVRQKATQELEKLGDRAVGACRRALERASSLESRQRLQAILDKEAQNRLNPPAEELRALRALEALEMAGTPAARSVVARLSRGAEARLTVEAKGTLARIEARR